ncbi:hypothetical protein GGX14DRAFT_395073 [Mycena pura]|uniref:Uncharacterized protein n=1 Tax=Mycena pura TaxID=153505 RepID=A0AAD6YA28_9AGAR|nr:hypothetical protein GGX14DRAFT_395073 [Mycena pura]
MLGMWPITFSDLENGVRGLKLAEIERWSGLFGDVALRGGVALRHSAGLRVRFDSSSESSLAYSHMVICVCSPSSSTQVTPRCRRWPMQRNSQRLPDSRVAFDKMPVEDRCWFGAFWKLGNHIVDEGADAILSFDKQIRYNFFS